MSEAETAKEQQLKQDAWAARKLLREARAAALSTAALGQPFAALVTPATTADCDILLLLSNLSEHTRHLRADPRCALFVAGDPDGPNPQTAPRVSITGVAEVVEDAALLARYLAVHPYAALYAGFTDFNLWRITPSAALFVGGFARATRLRATDLRPNPVTAARIANQAKDLLAEPPPDWLDHATNRAGLGEGWSIAGIDLDGIDLNMREHSARVSFAQPIALGQNLKDYLDTWSK